MSYDESWTRCAYGHEMPVGASACPSCGAVPAASVAPPVAGAAWYSDAEPVGALPVSPVASVPPPHASGPAVTVPPATASVGHPPVLPPAGFPHTAVQPAVPTPASVPPPLPPHQAVVQPGGVGSGFPQQAGVPTPAGGTGLDGVARWLIVAGAALVLVAPVLFAVLDGFRYGDSRAFYLVVPGPFDQYMNVGSFTIWVSPVGLLPLLGAAATGVLALTRRHAAAWVGIVTGVLVLLSFLLGAGDIIDVALRILLPGLLLIVGGVIALATRPRPSTAPFPVHMSPGMTAVAPGFVAPGVLAPTGADGMGIASFVLSLLGLFLCGPLAVVGVVLGHMSRGRTRSMYGRPDGMATAGTVVGWIGTVLWVALTILWIVLAASVQSY